MRRAHRKPTFQDICQSQNGAFPADVLHQLSDKEDIDFSDLSDGGSMLDGILPEPHPIDFEWRFDDDTAKQIADLIHREENILCVGTPTVFYFVAKTGANATLVDRNPLITESFKRIKLSHVICADAARFKAKLKTFSTAIMDPPWYTSDIDGWIANVLPLLSKHATLYIPIFRENTRPTARAERAEIIDRLSKVGSIKKIISSIRYRTPVFEAEVLSRLSLPKLPLWRLADLFQVTVSSAENWCCPSKREPGEHAWTRMKCGSQVVAIKISSRDDGPVYCTRSFEVRTVSRRDSARKNYTVWTSRNRAAEVKGISRLSRILGCTQIHRPYYCDEDVQAATQLAHDLKFPIKVECNEPNNHSAIS